MFSQTQYSFHNLCCNLFNETDSYTKQNVILLRAFWAEEVSIPHFVLLDKLLKNLSKDDFFPLVMLIFFAQSSV